MASLALAEASWFLLDFQPQEVFARISTFPVYSRLTELAKPDASKSFGSHLALCFRESDEFRSFFADLAAVSNGCFIMLALFGGAGVFVK